MKECTPVNLNHALVRLNITQVNLDIMLQLPCLRLGFKGGNSNIIQLKSLCSAVCILPSVCIHMQTDSDQIKKSSVKLAHLHCKTVINPKAYRYQQ